MSTGRSTSVSSPALIGRAHELGLLADLLAHTCGGQGQILAAQGQPTEAAQALGTAIDACAALGSRLEPARALEQRGALLRNQRAFAAAQADWAHARAICEEIGAQTLLWCLHAALGQLALDQQHLARGQYLCQAGR